MSKFREYEEMKWQIEAKAREKVIASYKCAKCGKPMNPHNYKATTLAGSKTTKYYCPSCD